MALERSRLATEIAAVERDRDREAGRAGLREQELAAARAELKELRKERRVLEGRSARLKRIEASRGHRAMVRFWRVRRAFLRPFRALRRSPSRS
jgi:transposase-like protein